MHTLNSRKTCHLVIPWIMNTSPHFQDSLVSFPYPQIPFLPAPESVKIPASHHITIQMPPLWRLPNSSSDIALLKACSPSGFDNLILPFQSDLSRPLPGHQSWSFPIHLSQQTLGHRFDTQVLILHLLSRYSYYTICSSCPWGLSYISF